MGIVASQGFALAQAADTAAWKPRLLWHNLVSVDTVSADQAAAGYPVTNLANPVTAQMWKSGSTATQKVTVLHSYTGAMDCIAIARHNLGSGGVPVAIETLDPGGDESDDADWTEYFASALLADDSTAMFFFTAHINNGFRLVLDPDATAPQIGVLMGGKALSLPNGLPPSNRPIKYARTVEATARTSEGGDYLGTVERTAGLRSSIEQRDIDAAWYYANLQPIADMGRRATFFFAPFPQTYPNLVSYCWTLNDPQPVINQRTGEIDITFDIGGLAI